MARREATVDKHQPAAIGVEDVLSHLAGDDLCIAICRRLKSRLRDRGDIGEEPVFMSLGRESNFGEAGHRRLADRQEPRTTTAGEVLLSSLKLRRVNVLNVSYFNHG